MSDFQPPQLTESGYFVEMVEFRDRMVVVNFTEPEQLKGPVQDHTSRVILLGHDEEIDAKIAEIMDDVQELLTLAHIARRNPPNSRPGRQP